MIYVVSGMVRTGTSMMMHALIKGGIPAIYEVGKDISVKARITREYDPNIDGMFELSYGMLLQRFPDDLDGEAVKIHDSQWLGLRDKYAKNGLSVVYMIRKPNDVLSSLCRLTFKDKPTRKEVARANFQINVAKNVANRKDVKALVVMKYEDVLDYPRKCFEYLVNEGFPINVERAMSVVKPSACHYRDSEIELPSSEEGEE